MRTNDLRRCLQPEAPLRLYRLPFVYVVEVPIGPGLIGQRPQPLGRLPCGRIRGQDMPMHPCWHMNLGADMPARAVDHDNHLLPRPGTDRLGKLRQSTCERGNQYCRKSSPPRSAGAWMHQCAEIAPLGARLHWGPWALASGLQTRRRMGLRPIRCWAIVQSSTTSCG